LFTEKRQTGTITSTWVMKDGTGMVVSRGYSASKGFHMNSKVPNLLKDHVEYLKLSKLWDRVDYMDSIKVIPD
jgi:hypothetical protein